jgi:hypothetical protein
VVAARQALLALQSPTFTTLAGWEWSTDRVRPPQRDPARPHDADARRRRLDHRPLQAAEAGPSAWTIPHHPSDTSFPNDFTVCDDRFTRLIEVYQARRGNFEFDGCYKQSPTAGTLGSFAQDALVQGHKFGDHREQRPRHTASLRLRARAVDRARRPLRPRC